MTYHHNNKDPNLNNIHHAMEYRDGVPHLRVNIGSDTVTINGDINVDNVTVDNLATDPVPISSNKTQNSSNNPLYVNIGTTGTVSLSASSLSALEHISIDNFPETQPISGTVALDSATLLALETINATVSGTVELGTTTLAALETINANVSGTVTVQDGGGSITVDGSVSISSLPEVEIKNDTGNPIPISKNTTANSTSNPLAVEWVYGSGASLIPWEVQVARGKIPGVTSLNISGFNGSVGTTYVPIWYGNTTYIYPATATQMRIWSDSASDTNVSVIISGLDSNYALLSETIILTNNSTGVLTVNSYLRINTLNLSRTPMNVGNIFCGNSAKTETYCVIEAGAGRSQQTIYTVPAGYTFYLEQSNWYTNNTGSNVGLYRSWTQTSAGVINIILQFPFPVNYNSRKTSPRPYLEKTDIQWQASSKSGASQIGGQIEGYLIANSVA